MENKKSRTIDEFFIEKYEKIEQENKELKVHKDYLIEENLKLNEEILELKNEYRELIEKLKKDLNIKIVEDDDTNYKMIYVDYISKNYQPELFDHYKQLFNLKEEGEEDNEQ